MMLAKGFAAACLAAGILMSAAPSQAQVYVGPGAFGPYTAQGAACYTEMGSCPTNMSRPLGEPCRCFFRPRRPVPGRVGP